MAMFWLGQWDSGTPDARYADGNVWSGQWDSGTPAARYADGEIWLDQWDSGTPDGRYADGRVWIGQWDSGTPDARYADGEVWLGQWDSGTPDARYDGSDGGAAAATLLLLLHELPAATSGGSDADEGEGPESAEDDSVSTKSHTESTPGGSGGYVTSSSSSSESGGLGVIGTIILIVVALAIWSNSKRPAAPPALEPHSVKIVGDGSPRAIISEIGSLLGKESPVQIIDRGVCPYQGCVYGDTWIPGEDVQGYAEPPLRLGVRPEALPRSLAIGKGTWLTTLTGIVIAERHNGRVDFGSLGTRYRSDVANGPPLRDGQTVAIYSYLGGGCYTSWIDGASYVVCGLEAGEATQEWWVQVSTKEGAKAWVNFSDTAFRSETARRSAEDIPASEAEVPGVAVGQVAVEVTIADTPQLTSAQENKRMADMLNRATSPRIDLNRNALVFDQAPPDTFENPTRRQYVEPAYPEIALRRQTEGEVLIEATIGTDGVVRDARVLRARSDLFDGPVLRAVNQWTYVPARFNGETVSVKMTAAVRFSIKPVAAPSAGSGPAPRNVTPAVSEPAPTTPAPAPAMTSTHPMGAVARCASGGLVYNSTGSRTCEDAGGVVEWFTTSRTGRCWPASYAGTVATSSPKILREVLVTIDHCDPETGTFSGSVRWTQGGTAMSAPASGTITVSNFTFSETAGTGTARLQRQSGVWEGTWTPTTGESRGIVLKEK